MRLLIAICLFGALAYSQTPTDDNLPLTCSECAEQGFTWCAGEGSTGICFQEKDHGHRRGHEGEGEGESEGGHRHRGGRHRNRPHSLMDLVTMPVVLPNQPQPNEPSQPMPIPGQPTPTPEPDRDGRWGGRGWDHSRRHRDGGEHRDHGRWDHRRGPPTATPTDPAQPPPTTTEPAFPTEPNQGNGGSGSGDEQHGWNGRHHHRRHHDRDGRDGHADGTTGSSDSNDNESGDGEGQSHESGRDHNDHGNDHHNGQPGQPDQQQPDRHHWHDGGEGEGEGERRRGGGGGGHGGWGWRHPQPPSSPPSSPPQQPQLPPSTDLPLPVAPMQPQDPPQDPSQPAQPSDPDFPVDPVTDPRVNMPIECPSGSDVSCKACVAVTGCQYCRSAQGQPKCGLLGSFECDKSASNIARINFPIIADSLCPADGMEPVVVIIVPQPPTQPVKPVQPPVVPPSGPRPPVMPPPSSPPRCAPGATLIRRAEQCANNNNGGGNDDDRMGDHKRHHRHHHGSKSFFHKLGMSQTVGLLVFVFLPALVCACAMIRCLRRARRRAILQVSIHPPAAPSSAAAPASASSSSSARNGGVSLPAVSTVEVRRPLLASSEAPASEDDGVAASEDAGEGEVMPTQAVLMIRDEVVTSDMDPADMEGEMPPSEGEVSLDRPKTKRSFLSRLLPNKTKPANNYVRINE